MDPYLHRTDWTFLLFRSLKSLGAWCSEEDDINQWFEIDLLTTTNVSAVASQGVEIKGDGGHWVTQ